MTLNYSSKIKRLKCNILCLSFNSAYRHSVPCIDISKCSWVLFEVTPTQNSHSVNKHNNGRNWTNGLDKVKMFGQKLSMDATSFWCLRGICIVYRSLNLLRVIFDYLVNYLAKYLLACLMHTAWSHQICYKQPAITWIWQCKRHKTPNYSTSGQIFCLLRIIKRRYRQVGIQIKHW